MYAFVVLVSVVAPGSLVSTYNHLHRLLSCCLQPVLEAMRSSVGSSNSIQLSKCHRFLGEYIYLTREVRNALNDFDFLCCARQTIKDTQGGGGGGGGGDGDGGGCVACVTDLILHLTVTVMVTARGVAWGE